MDIFVAILVFLIGVFAAFIGVSVGGGGLISIPAMIFVGLPPTISIATNKFAALGRDVTGFYNFWKTGKIDLKFSVNYLPLKRQASHSLYL